MRLGVVSNQYWILDLFEVLHEVYHLELRVRYEVLEVRWDWIRERRK